MTLFALSSGPRWDLGALLHSRGTRARLRIVLFGLVLARARAAGRCLLPGAYRVVGLQRIRWGGVGVDEALKANSALSFLAGARPPLSCHVLHEVAGALSFGASPDALFDPAGGP